MCPAELHNCAIAVRSQLQIGVNKGTSAFQRNFIYRSSWWARFGLCAMVYQSLMQKKDKVEERLSGRKSFLYYIFTPTKFSSFTDNYAVVLYSQTLKLLSL